MDNSQALPTTHITPTTSRATRTDNLLARPRLETFSRQDAINAGQQRQSRLREQLRRLLQHRPQSWRHLLGLLSGAHFSLVFGRFISDAVFNGLRLNMLSAYAVVIALPTRLTWQALFINPYAFLGYQRPNKGYRVAVCLASVVTTLPALIVHAMLIPVSAKSRFKTTDLVQSIVALLLLIATIALYVWMVFRFLFRHNQEHYEPTVRVASPEASGDVTAAISTGLTLTGTSAEILNPVGHLSRAYAQQRARRQAGSPDGHDQLAAQSVAAPPDTGTATASTLSLGPRCCRTIAWIDHKPRSWLFDPLVPLVLGAYGTLLAYHVYMLVRENSLSKFYSPKAKCGLYAPLGVYLLCAYASKRFIRTSFFARIQVSPPDPWVLVDTLFGKPVFRNAEDGSKTQVDPRLRVAPLDARDYVARYNAVRPRCDEYWGHLGRRWINVLRFRPVLFRFVLLGLASFLFAKGSVCIFSYPTNTEEYGRRPDMTVPDWKRQLRIFALEQKLIYELAPLIVIVTLYAIACGGYLFGLWTDAVLKYAPPREYLRELEI